MKHRKENDPKIQNELEERTKELVKAGFTRVGKSEVYQCGEIAAIPSSEGFPRLLINYDGHFDWSKVTGIKTGRELGSFCLTYIEEDGDVTKKTIDEGGGGVWERVPKQKDFNGKTFKEQLLNSRFVQDPFEPRVFRLNVPHGKTRAEIVVVLDTNGKLSMVYKDISTSGTRLITSDSHILSAKSGRHHKYKWPVTCLTVENNALQYQISSEASGSIIEGSQKLHRPILASELGIFPFAVKVEQSGFRIGGINDTETIKVLKSIAGRSIYELEENMKARQGLGKKWLSLNESLVKVLAKDNDYVLSRALNHQTVAEPLIYAREHFLKGYGSEFFYASQKYTVEMYGWRCVFSSPFKDGTSTNSDMIITNVETGKSFRCSCLLADTIQRYGFYEGNDYDKYTNRLEPEAIIDFFNLSNRVKITE